MCCNLGVGCSKRVLVVSAGVAVCCSVLHCVAVTSRVCCSVLQSEGRRQQIIVCRVSRCCSVLQCVAACCRDVRGVL